MEILNSIWYEKYRPKKIEDMVLPEDYKLNFKAFISSREIPMLMLYGPPGGGKTAISQILCSPNGILKNPRENLLEINGSAQKTRGIGFVEETIEPFLKIPPDNLDKHKIVFIDESDSLTSASMKSLRNIIETYSDTGRFIFTCNELSKIEDAIISRCQVYKFKQMPIEFVKTLIIDILNNEQVRFIKEDLDYICELLYPDIRQIINTTQQHTMSGELKIDKNEILTNERKIITLTLELINFLNSNNKSKINSIIPEIIKNLNDRDIEYKRIYEELFYRGEIQANCKIIINKYSNNHQSCLISSMNFMSMIFEIITTINKYNELGGKMK